GLTAVPTRRSSDLRVKVALGQVRIVSRHMAELSVYAVRWVFRSIVTSDSGIVTRQSGIVITDSDDHDHLSGRRRDQARIGLYVKGFPTPGPGSGSRVRTAANQASEAAALRRSGGRVYAACFWQLSR